MFRRHAISSCRSLFYAVFHSLHRGIVKRTPLCRTLATETQPFPTTASPPSPQPNPSKKSTKPRLSTAIILNRSPVLTRSPTPFEQAYYAYQARIRRALHQPFPFDFYFKQGSLLETRFNLEEKDREKAAFGLSFVQDDYQDPAKAEADKAAVKLLAQQEGEGESLASREHPSDKSGDTKSLDRAGERNLYLLLRENGKDVWRFPQGGVEKSDFLHQVGYSFTLVLRYADMLQAAHKELHAECGENMDTWIVSRNPIGVYKPSQPDPAALEVCNYLTIHNAVTYFLGSILYFSTRLTSWQVRFSRQRVSRILLG